MLPFPGARPFVLDAARELGLDPRDTHQATRLEPIRNAEQVLGQLANAKPEHKAEIVKNVRRWRGVLAAALMGLDAALRSLEPADDSAPADAAAAAPREPKHSRPRDRRQ